MPATIRIPQFLYHLISSSHNFLILTFLPGLQPTSSHTAILHNYARFPLSVDSTWMDGNCPLSFWNCYDRTLNGEPRTNSVAEGGNNAIRAAFGYSKPVIWKCLDKVKEFQSQTDLILVQHFPGQSNGLKPRRKEYCLRV